MKFRRHIDDAYRAGAGGDGRMASDYDLIDPRAIKDASSKRQKV